MNWIFVMVIVISPEQSDYMVHGFQTEQACKAAVISAKAGIESQLKEPALIVSGCFPAPKKGPSA